MLDVRFDGTTTLLVSFQSPSAANSRALILKTPLFLKSKEVLSLFPHLSVGYSFVEAMLWLSAWPVSMVLPNVLV